MAKAYDFDGWHFDTQTELESSIKAHLGTVPKNRRFRDELLLAVVNHLHPDVRSAGQTAVALEYLDYQEQRLRNMVTADLYRGGPVIMGFFEPLHEWRDVTVYPWRRSSGRTEVKQAFRAIIGPHLPKPKPHHRCVMPGCGADWQSLEYQHVAPTFNEIAEQCLALCTEDEIAIRFGYNKFQSRASVFSIADVIPATHPAVIELLRLHRGSQWAWLCPEHHRGVIAPQLRLEMAS